MNNKMRGRFTVLGYGENEVQGSMTVKVRKNSDLSSKIQIRPRNKMEGIFDIIEPPLIINTLSSIKDSMIYNKIDTLNYGNEKSMLIGYNPETNENYYSLIEFDISTIEKNKELKYSKLRLHSDLQLNDVELALCESLEQWDEDGVTWKNKPPIGDIVATGFAGGTQGYVEFDILNIVQDWYEGKKINNGLFLTLKSHVQSFQDQDFSVMNTNSEYVQFSTNQSSNPPIIEVAYYEDVKSVGLSKLQSSVSIRQTVPKDLLSRLQLNSRFRNENLQSNITIKQYFGDTSINGSLTIKKKMLSDMQSNIQLIKKDRNNNIDSIIGIKHGSNLISSLQLIKKDKESDLLSNLTIKERFNNNLNSNLQLVKKNIDNSIESSLSLKARKDLESTLKIENKLRDNEVVSQVTIRSKSNIDSNIIIPYRKNLNSSLKVMYSSSLPSSIVVNSYFLMSQLIVRVKDDSGIESSMLVRNRRISEIESIMTVTKYSDLESSVTIREVTNDVTYGYVFIL